VIAVNVLVGHGFWSPQISNLVFYRDCLVKPAGLLGILKKQVSKFAEYSGISFLRKASYSAII
jgi:hypothetical protein